MPTEIEWTNLLPGYKGETWNPVTGCEKVSAGCKFCYAEKFAGRKMNEWAGERKFTDVICYENRLDIPLHWKQPRLVFVNSMSDLFHPAVSFEFIDKVYAQMGRNQQHIYIILTKRPERAVEYYKTIGVGTKHAFSGKPYNLAILANEWPLSNVWLGVSVEDQNSADERIPILLQIPAFIRWVSYEPALGPVDFTRINTKIHFDKKGILGVGDAHDWYQNVLSKFPIQVLHPSKGFITETPASIDWIVMGGESGHKARPMNPEWVRKTRDDCKAANVSFFFKQWGEWLGSYSQVETAKRSDEHTIWHMHNDHTIVPSFKHGKYFWHYMEGNKVKGVKSDHMYLWQDDGVVSAKIGRSLTGRLLDDKEYNEYPVNGLQ